MRELRLFYIIIVQIKPTHKTDRGKEWRIVLCFQTNFGGKKFKCKDSLNAKSQNPLLIQHHPIKRKRECAGER